MTASVLPLSELQPGRRARVLHVRHGGHERLVRLAMLGLVPGAVVEVEQAWPALVVHVGETTLALDAAVADAVCVEPIEPEGEAP